jgi:excisionase family DNA binding protein
MRKPDRSTPSAATIPAESFLTIADLAARWRCSKRHVQRVIAGGGLPVHRMGKRRLLISLWDVKAFEAMRRAGT